MGRREQMILSIVNDKNNLFMTEFILYYGHLWHKQISENKLKLFSSKIAQFVLGKHACPKQLI